MVNEEQLTSYNERKATKNYNLTLLADCVYPYHLCQNTTVVFDTPEGKVCFYPSIDTFQHEGGVSLGNAHVVMHYVPSLYKEDATLHG